MCLPLFPFYLLKLLKNQMPYFSLWFLLLKFNYVLECRIFSCFTVYNQILFWLFNHLKLLQVRNLLFLALSTFCHFLMIIFDRTHSFLWLPTFWLSMNSCSRTLNHRCFWTCFCIRKRILKRRFSYNFIRTIIDFKWYWRSWQKCFLKFSRFRLLSISLRTKLTGILFSTCLQGHSNKWRVMTLKLCW